MPETKEAAPTTGSDRRRLARMGRTARLLASMPLEDRNWVYERVRYDLVKAANEKLNPPPTQSGEGG